MLCSAVLCLAVGCATGTADDDWQTAPIGKATAAQRAETGGPARRLERSENQSQREKTDLKAWAANHRNPNRCVLAARQKITVSRKQALTLLRACSHRADFDILAPLLRSPWLPLLKRSNTVGYRILLKAIATRNDFEADFGSMQAAGFNISAMGLASAADGKLTPVVGVLANGPGSRRVEEFEREKRKYGRQPGRWRRTEYRVSRYGRQIIGKRYFTVESSRSPGGFIATGRVLKFDKGVRCPGPDNAAKLMLIRLGARIRSDSGEDLFDATVVACHGMR